MKKEKKENLTLFKDFIFSRLYHNIWDDFFYKLILLSLIFLSVYSMIRLSALFFNIRNYFIFVFNYFSIILFIIFFPLLIFQNYLGKYLRKIDIKNIFESYMIIKRESNSNSQYFANILEDIVLKTDNKKIKIKRNWKIIFIFLIIFLLFFIFGSIFSFYQYGKVIYKIIPSEYKEVLTMQSIVEKLLNQLDEESEQFKILNNLYNQYTSSFTQSGINQKEYLERLNQILQQSIASGLSNEDKYKFAKGSTSANIYDKNNSSSKVQKGKLDLLSQKYIEQEQENEKIIIEKQTKINIQKNEIRESFLDFLKTRLFHPENPKNEGKPGYQSQDIKDYTVNSPDYSTLLQTIYSSSSEFSYSLSNQLTPTQKIEIFNFILKQFNINPSNVSFDEEFFYKLILLYFEMLNKEKE